MYGSHLFLDVNFTAAPGLDFPVAVAVSPQNLLGFPGTKAHVVCKIHQQCSLQCPRPGDSPSAWDSLQDGRHRVWAQGLRSWWGPLCSWHLRVWARLAVGGKVGGVCHGSQGQEPMTCVVAVHPLPGGLNHHPVCRGEGTGFPHRCQLPSSLAPAHS